MHACARREQTRLRRETARREAAGMEMTYQPMSVYDMRFTLIRLAVAAVLLIAGLILPWYVASLVLYLIAYLITVLPVAATVARHITHGKYFDEYLLILLASFGAFLLGHRAEASVILILHSLGRIVSDFVLSSTHKSHDAADDLCARSRFGRQYAGRGAAGRAVAGAHRRVSFWSARASACRSTASCCAAKARWMKLC